MDTAPQAIRPVGLFPVQPYTQSMTIRASLAKGQDPGIVPYVGVGYAWFVGTGILTSSGNDTIKMTIENPIDSGVNVNLARLRLTSDTSHIVKLWLNPTTNLPSASRTISNAILDGRVYGGGTLVKSGVGVVMSGGTELSATFGVGGQGGDVVVDGPFILPPGHKLGIGTHVQPGIVEGAFNLLWEEH